MQINALMAIIFKGIFKEGWKAYEYRWKVDPGQGQMAYRGEDWEGSMTEM